LGQSRWYGARRAAPGRPGRTGSVGLADLHLGMIEIGGIEVIAVLSVCAVLGALTFDAMEYLFALHGHAFGRIDTQSHLIALDAQHRHRDFVPDHHRFTDSTRQD
jgi:hypothetical protein